MQVQYCLHLGAHKHGRMCACVFINRERLRTLEKRDLKNKTCQSCKNKETSICLDNKKNVGKR